jgi:hypothetical protein
VFLFEGLVNRVNNFKPLRLAEIPATHDSQLRSPHLRDGILYHSRDPARPEVIGTFNASLRQIFDHQPGIHPFPCSTTVPFDSVIFLARLAI